MAFADRLRERRKALGKTVSQCASVLGKTQPAWTLYESGKRTPKIEELIEICNLLDCTPNDLLLEHHTSPVINASHGGAVAIGDGAKASGRVTIAAERSDCRKCPYKLAVKRMQRAGMTLAGID